MTRSLRSSLSPCTTALLAVAALLLPMPLAAQTTPAPAPAADPWATLAFLQGTWTANAQTANSQAANTQASATSLGTYTFRTELGGHILARHGRTSACKAPDSFDCDHGDLLYLFRDAPSAPLKAIYFDNEGHVIHYDVTTPSPTKAVFLSDPAGPGPQFRLTYELKANTMQGAFEMHMPGSPDWHTYLAWTGTQQPGTQQPGTQQPTPK